jgi:hypothetical protein
MMMKTSTTIRGYSVKGRDAVLGVTFLTGLESTEKKARKSLEQMLASPQYSEKEKKSLRVVRISEVIEEI